MEKGIKLCSDSGKSVTSVSNFFIDDYMCDANGEFVKVYLYLLRCINSDTDTLSLSKIADKLNNTEKDITRALKYWEKMNLLSLEYDDDKIVGIDFVEPVKSSSASKNLIKLNKPAASVTPIKEITKAVPAAKQEVSYSATQIKEFKNNEDIKQTLFIIEQYLCKTLSPGEIEKILYFYDNLGFNLDFIEFLFEFCIERGQKSMAYINKVALDWHKNGYTTRAQVKAANESNTSYYKAVMKSFGIQNRSLIEPEKNIIDGWITNYGSTIELITEACEKTILTIHKPSFEYADTILKNWSTGASKPKATVKKLTPKQTNVNTKKAAFTQRKYDFSALERALINADNEVMM